MSYTLEPLPKDCWHKVPQGHVRIECRVGAMGLGPNIAAELLDISQTGASLVLTSNVGVGAEVEIVLHGSVYAKPIRVMAEVVRPLTTVDGRPAVSVRFAKALTYHTWQLLT